jgi:hypothetical protein
VADAGSFEPDAAAILDAEPGGVDAVELDPPAGRDLDVVAERRRITHTFRASEADPGVTFNDGTQIAALDPRSIKMVGKLVLPFGGVGSTNGGLGSEGNFLLPRGFHVLGIAAFQDYGILHCDAEFYGDAREQVFDGITHTTSYDFEDIMMAPNDGVAMRTKKALEYLAANYPDEDWAYFLDKDGNVRWSDVIFTGFSHGASNAARFAVLVRASRAVSFAGPRDNSAGPGQDGQCPTLVSATWLHDEPATPRDRFYALTGVADSQHFQHLYAMEALGYSGVPTNLETGSPWSGSHRIVGPGGHGSPCGQSEYRDLCNYLFGVDPLNYEGVR